MLTCPMCQGGTLKFFNYKESRLFSCNECPFVGADYYTDKDVATLAEYLKEKTFVCDGCGSNFHAGKVCHYCGSKSITQVE